MKVFNFIFAIHLMYSLAFLLPNERDKVSSGSNSYNSPCSVSHQNTSLDKANLSESEKDALAHNSAILEQMALDGQILKIPVRAVFFDNDIGVGAIRTELDYTNARYFSEGFNVKLVLVEASNYNDQYLNDTYDCIDDSQWDNCDKPVLWDPLNSYGKSGYINLFYLTLDGLSQHANFPSYPDNNRTNTVVLNKDYLFNGWSIMHELGHTFGLYHTFETGKGKENVTRDPADSCYDCDKDGDYICDTPAALNLGFGSTSNNTYGGMNGGSEEDECGDGEFSMWYTSGAPNDGCNVQYEMNQLVYKNIMNYGSRWCSQDFTDGQVARMWEFMPTKVGQLNMEFVGYCDFVNINLGSGTVQNGKHIETPRQIISQQTITSWDQQLNFYGADEGVRLLPGFRATSTSNFQAIPVAEGCN